MISIEWVTDNKWRIGDREYGYFYCDINFSQEAIDEGDLTEDDMIDLCEAVKSALLTALKDKENDYTD